jgi:hypothetical protein
VVENSVRILVQHLQDWGGRPSLSIFGRPKTIILEWEKNDEVTKWNPVFASATVEIGIGVELCWPCQARQKGSPRLSGVREVFFFQGPQVL